MYEGSMKLGTVSVWNTWYLFVREHIYSIRVLTIISWQVNLGLPVTVKLSCIRHTESLVMSIFSFIVPQCDANQDSSQLSVSISVLYIHEQAIKHLYMHLVWMQQCFPSAHQLLGLSLDYSIIPTFLWTADDLQLEIRRMNPHNYKYRCWWFTTKWDGECQKSVTTVNTEKACWPLSPREISISSIVAFITL